MWGEIGSFLANNWKPIAGAVTSGYGIYENNRARKEYERQIKAEEDAAYQDELQAYNDRQARAASSGGGGGGGGSRSGGGGGGKNAALGIQQDYLNQLRKLYAPYEEAQKQLVPIQTETHKKTLESLNMLRGYLMNPEVLKKMNASIPASDVNIPLPMRQNG